MRRFALVYLIFILSGAAGLIYEVVWARQLVLVFGNTTQAVSAILTGFFGGIAIGSVVGGRMADRVRSPLRLYGLLELALVAVVIVTPVTFRLIHVMYRGAYGPLETSPHLLALTRFGLSMLALAPATVLMGATLPTLTRHLSIRGDHLSAAFGRLYAANTIGAILGTLLSGLVLIELLGLTGAMLVGAACSAVAGVVAIALARSSPQRGEVTMPAAANAPASMGDARANSRLVLGVAFVSGLTSLGYQVLWTRLLASGTGGSTYVFTLILAVFLAGIAGGAILFSVFRARLRDPIALLAIAQAAVALLVLWGLVNVIAYPGGINPQEPLQALGSVWREVLPVVLPATLLMGLAFPTTSLLLEGRDGRIATTAGRLLAANTLGAISGTFVVPFLIIPAIGSPSAVVALGLINCGTALALAVVRVRRHVMRVGIAATALAVAAALMSSLLAPGRVIDPSAARIRDANGTVDASAEDEIAAVQAGRARGLRQLWVTGTSMTALTVDARLMSVLPLMLRPDATTALTVAFGMGSSYRTALRAGLEVEAVELVPSVPRMFGYFYPDASSILADPRGSLVIADGRNHVELTSRRFDIIVTDPPPPIQAAGVSVISSREYYEAGRNRLAPGGAMMQWVPYGQTLDEFRAQVRTFRAVFPNVLVALGPGGNGFLIVGSLEPLQLTDEGIVATLRRPNVLDDLSSAFDSPVHSEAEWLRLIPSLVWIQGDDVARFAGDGPLITDDHPLPEYFLLRQLFGPSSPAVSPTILRQFVAP